MAIKCLFLTYRNSNGNLNGYNLFCKETAGIDGRFHMWIVMRMVMVSSEWLTNHTNHVCFSVIDTTTHRRPSRHYATFNLNIFVERCVMDLKFFIPLANYTTVKLMLLTYKNIGRKLTDVPYPSVVSDCSFIYQTYCTNLRVKETLSQ